MGIIRQLSASVINQIAAGEVVERPASVVKELLENAIDAGATRVDISVERGGKDLVRVADDGKGMTPDDLPMAFTPHATSKLAEAEDLFRIATLGFRGEALAAIAEVSKTRCQSRTPDVEVGCEIEIDAGVAGPIKECGGAKGTVIEVRNLFYNIPVRRAYLKSDSTEAGHVIEVFTRVALAHPAVHLTFRSGGKVVYDLPAVTGIKDRVTAFFGKELAESLLWVESEHDDIHLWGYVAHPAQSRSTNKGQFLFVGGRYVRDRSLSHALTEAYRGLLMVGRQPVAFLHLDIPPDQVDVNVHPTKVEVRFRDSQRIYSQLLATVRQTFLQSDLHSRLQAPGADPEFTGPPVPLYSAPAPRAPVIPVPPEVPFRLQTPAAPDKQSVAEWFQPNKPFQSFPNPGYAGGPPLQTPKVHDWAKSLPPAGGLSAGRSFDEFEAPTIVPSAWNIPQAQDETQTPKGFDTPLYDGEVPNEPAAEGPIPPNPQDVPYSRLPSRAIQVHDSYLVAETDDGMVVIDQHALHERILFEEFRQRLEAGGVESQRLLVPEPVELTPGEANDLVEHKEVLAKLGLEVEPFGGGTVLVTAVPAMLRGVRPETLVRDLADHFHSKPTPPTADQMLQDVLAMMACKAAIKAGQRLNLEEVSALLERRHLVNDVHHCPHGRPTALIFSKAELEKQFGRT